MKARSKHSAIFAAQRKSAGTGLIAQGITPNNRAGRRLEKKLDEGRKLRRLWKDDK